MISKGNDILFDKALRQIFKLSRTKKRITQLIVDVILLFSSFVVSIYLRTPNFDFVKNPLVWSVFLPVLLISLFVFIRIGLYRAVVRYISTKAIYMVLAGATFSAVLLLTVSQVFGLRIPRSVPAIYAVLVFFSVGGVRYLIRSIYHRRQLRRKSSVIIYGAGEPGRQLARALNNSLEYFPVAFVDDTKENHYSEIEGLRVYPPSEIEALIENFNADTVLLAVASLSSSDRNAILRRLEPLPVHVQTIPSVADLVTGRARLTDIREVEIEDLLGRDPVRPDEALLDRTLVGKVVMVTGAGGSIGGELCRQILTRGPTMLILFEMSEIALYTIEVELRSLLLQTRVDTKIVAVLGSLQEASLLCSIVKKYSIQTIYHAAAYKHVPIVEENVIEGVRNNVFGTYNLAKAAMEGEVETFMLISTDKAVRPTNIMGATKRIAELICQGFAKKEIKTKFSMVRFGNVLESSGSVIPVFRKQIALGGPITVTHPEITRYFMTIPEAAQLVIQAAALSSGGDVFLLDMGEPIKIVDLAKQMARLSGLTPYISGVNLGASLDYEGDIEIVFTGLRPGEKLYEELLIGNGGSKTSHSRIVAADEKSMDYVVLEALLDALREACNSFDEKAVRRLIKEAPTGYAAA